MPGWDQQSFLTNYAPPQNGATYGGGDNITGTGRGPAVPAYPGGSRQSSDSTPITASMDGVPGARAQQALMWFGGEWATVLSITVVIEEQLSTLPYGASGAAGPAPGVAPTASGVYRPLGIAKFGRYAPTALTGSNDAWTAQSSASTTAGWIADPNAVTDNSTTTITVAGVAQPPCSGTGTSGNGSGTSGSNGRMYTQCIFQADYQAYSINYNVIEFLTTGSGGETAYGFNCVVIPFMTSSKQVGSPA